MLPPIRNFRLLPQFPDKSFFASSYLKFHLKFAIFLFKQYGQQHFPPLQFCLISTENSRMNTVIPLPHFSSKRVTHVWNFTFSVDSFGENYQFHFASPPPIEMWFLRARRRQLQKRTISPTTIFNIYNVTKINLQWTHL